jgi:hypothetical protein
MSALLQCLRKPHPWLLMLLLTVTACLVDSSRSPRDQLTVPLYVGAVRLYQRFCRPVVSKWIRCRYRPTCSEYSIDAVRRYGIRTGLVLTSRRVRSCTPGVQPGAYDPVP